MFYSTPSRYMDAINQASLVWYVNRDDFFPYADLPYAYWTGTVLVHCSSNNNNNTCGPFDRLSVCTSDNLYILLILNFGICIILCILIIIIILLLILASQATACIH